jgi:hypothetical protein
VCLDAPVLAAAFATRGLCADVLRLVLVQYRLVCGRSVLSELRRLLTERLQVPTLSADQIIPFVREQAEVSNPSRPVAAVDTAQGWLLASAMDAGADVLVTHRWALLQSRASLPLTVTNTRGFWELVREEGHDGTGPLPRSGPRHHQS